MLSTLFKLDFKQIQNTMKEPTTFLSSAYMYQQKKVKIGQFQDKKFENSFPRPKQQWNGHFKGQGPIFWGLVCS